MFTIEIEYSTGDSFHQESGLRSKVGWAWNKIEDAQEALARISGHYKAIRNKAKLSPSIEKSPWFAKTEYDMWKYRVKVPDGKGEETIIDAFWCGYFESMQEAKIVVEGSTKNSVRF